MAIMKVICTGWAGVTHDPPVIIREKVGTIEGVSNGICASCEARMNERMDQGTIARRLTELDFHGGEQ